MPGETDVVNVSLRLIGHDPIVTINDGSETGNLIDDLYTEVRDDLLRSHPWNFATKRVKLAQSSTVPTFEFDHAYPLPADWLRTVSVHHNDAGHGTILFRMESLDSQNAIITSSDEVWIRYIFRATDPNIMTADFRRALELSLARDLSVPLASSNTLQDQLSKQANRKIAQARSIDALGSFPERRPIGSWASSRGGRSRDFLSD